MELVLYTQRVETVKNYGERRDCTDQNIPRFIMACGFLPIPVPNICEIAEDIQVRLHPAGIILTGGNSLVRYGGDAPERDETEYKMLEYAIAHKMPVYGFCRGMQVILDYYACKLVQVEGHVAVRHKISGRLGEQEVNSFHNQACVTVKEPLEILAQTEDGVIEAVCCREKKILATMWHPEREQEFKREDLERVRHLFGR